MLLFVFELAASSNWQPGKTSGRPKIGATALVALASVSLFDIGMVGRMVFLHLNNFMPPPTDIVFTLQMQNGMILGLITAYPLVAWRTRRRTAATTITTEPGLGTPELVHPWPQTWWALQGSSGKRAGVGDRSRGDQRIAAIGVGPGRYAIIVRHDLLD